MVAASATHLVNVFPSLLELPEPELYQRLKDILMTTVLALDEFRNTWAIPPMPMPSDN